MFSMVHRLQTSDISSGDAPSGLESLSSERTQVEAKPTSGWFSSVRAKVYAGLVALGLAGVGYVENKPTIDTAVSSLLSAEYAQRDVVAALQQQGFEASIVRDTEGVEPRAVVVGVPIHDVYHLTSKEVETLQRIMGTIGASQVKVFLQNTGDVIRLQHALSWLHQQDKLDEDANAWIDPSVETDSSKKETIQQRTQEMSQRNPNAAETANHFGHVVTFANIVHAQGGTLQLKSEPVTHASTMGVNTEVQLMAANGEKDPTMSKAPVLIIGSPKQLHALTEGLKPDPNNALSKRARVRVIQVQEPTSIGTLTATE